MFNGPQLQKQVKQSYGSCVLHIVSWCFTFVWSFIKVSEMVSNLQSWHEYMVEMVIFNIYYVQRVVTPEVG